MKMNEFERKSAKLIIFIQIIVASVLIFLVLGNAGFQVVLGASTRNPITINYPEQDIKSTNAILKADVKNPEKKEIHKVGMYLYNDSGKLIQKKSEKCFRNESLFHITYNVNTELGVKLKANTTYRCMFFVIDDGQEIKGDVYQFTTKNTLIPSTIIAAIIGAVGVVIAALVGMKINKK